MADIVPGNTGGMSASIPPATGTPAAEPEWKAKFPGGEGELWKAYNSIVSDRDRIKSEYEKAPKGQDYSQFGDKMMEEFGKGSFSDDTKKFLQNVKMDPDGVFQYMVHKGKEQLAPLQPFLKDVPIDKAMDAFTKGASPAQFEAFKAALGVSPEAAATIMKSFISSGAPKGPDLKVGAQAGDSGGGGYDTFESFQKDQKSIREWDKAGMAAIEQKFKNTNPELRQLWMKKIVSGV